MDKRLLLLPLTLMVFACSTTGSTGPRRSSNVLLADEIAGVAALTAYEAVQQTRTQWLRMRGLRAGQTPTMGGANPALPVVYLDGTRIGDVDELRRIRSEVVERMEFLSPSDATNRFGTNHDSGAILVTTRGGS